MYDAVDSGGADASSYSCSMNGVGVKGGRLDSTYGRGPFYPSVQTI